MVAFSQGYYFHKNSTVESVEASQPAVVEVTYSEPRLITISGFINNLPIQSGTYFDGEWTVSDDTASYLIQSALPGEAGNTIIYGHNLPSIFGPLQQLKGGEKIVITTAAGDQHTYTVTEVLEVTLDQVEYLAPTQEEILTLYTCAGWLDTKRLVVRAHPG